MPKPEKRDRAAAFAFAFVANGGNGADAARQARYSPNGAAVTANRLLRHANVLAIIEDERQKIREKYRLTAANMLRSLEQALFFDPRNLFRADGSLKGIHELDEDTAMALQAIESEVVVNKRTGRATFHLKKVKWLDRNAARDQANKILGHYKADKTPDDDPRVSALDRATKSSESVAERIKAVLAHHAGAPKQ